MQASSRSPLACVGENMLAAFAEGQVDPRLHGTIEEHLADCNDCRVVLVRVAGVMPINDAGSNIDSEGASDGPELPAGTRVGRYLIEKRIGRGAMGTVYAANDPDLDRKVAVKLLRSSTLSDAARHQMRARLLREAQAMARLSHPEVITVYDVGTLGEQLFVAMEYVEAETLRCWRAAHHRGYGDILAVYERAGSGLAAAHEAGLVHRDFKPDNVLVGRDGRVRVTDFGLARSLGRREEMIGQASTEVVRSETQGQILTLTRTGALIGTPAYMAPEQLRGGAADARSDVFSFSVALYEALYGERPFPGPTVSALLASIERGAVRPAPIMTRVPRWVRAVLLCGLRADPGQRFASMRALLDALRASHVASRRRSGGAIGVVVSGLGVVATAVISSRGVPSVSLHEASASSPSFAASEGAPVAPPRSVDLERLAPAPQATARPSSAAPLPSSSSVRLPSTSHRTLAPPARAQAAPSAAASYAPLVGNNGALILE